MSAKVYISVTDDKQRLIVDGSLVLFATLLQNLITKTENDTDKQRGLLPPDPPQAPCPKPSQDQPA